MFISNLYANAPATAPNILAQLMPLIIIVVVFYFLLIRPQKKRQQQHLAMINSLKVGDDVITNGGILGKVSVVLEHEVELEIAAGVNIKIRKNAITTLASAEKEVEEKANKAKK